MLPATTDNFIFPLLSPAGLVKYSLLCRSAHAAAAAYCARTFKIDRYLSRFFTPVEILLFRYWQACKGMFISGSTALQFFNRAQYFDSDLDLYVEHRHCREIAYWLLSIGYTYVPRKRTQAEDLDEALKENMSYDRVNFTIPVTQGFFQSTSMGYFGRGVANVYNFEKESPYLKIQLVTSFYSPLEVVLNFHSTCVMNIITHDTAYSLYPYATFEERRSLVISTEGSKQEKARAKYARRGWSLVERLSADEVQDSKSAFARGHRYIGDSRCWVIPILPKLDLPGGFMETKLLGADI